MRRRNDSFARSPTESVASAWRKSIYFRDSSGRYRSVGGGRSREAPTTKSVPARHVLYTATYRHTVKGTERGKWIVDVVAEGSAPLVTIEEVVRGVVRRSAEPFRARADHRRSVQSDRTSATSSRIGTGLTRTAEHPAAMQRARTASSSWPVMRDGRARLHCRAT